MRGRLPLGMLGNGSEVGCCRLYLQGGAYLGRCPIRLGLVRRDPFGRLRVWMIGCGWVFVELQDEEVLFLGYRLGVGFGNRRLVLLVLVLRMMRGGDQ